MLDQAPAVAFVGASDLEVARTFYEGVLGLTIVSQSDFVIELRAGGVSVRISKPPEVTPASYAVLGFVVDDVRVTAKALAARGVVFERYAGFAQDENGVWAAPSGAHVAWFKDPDGNLLSISDA